MSIYIEVDGDATRPQLDSPDEIVIMPHICNNKKIFGGGFTGALNRAFGNGPYNTYINMAKSPNRLDNFLGEISVCNIKNENKIFVINMIAQNGVIGALNPKPIKYWALMKCMEAVKQYIGLNIVPLEKPFRIHTCRFGSQLAGGNWALIKELIEEIWVDADIDVVIYNYKK